jgi:hypothetical protein
MELKLQVKQILEDYPFTRNDDINLMLILWESYHQDNYRLLKKGLVGVLHHLPYQESIKRYRAMYQAKGQYLPTSWEVAKQRRMKEDWWREKLNYKPFKNYSND